VRIAAGDADPLGGRFLHAEDDLDELLADAARIRAQDLLTPAPAGASRGLSPGRRAGPGRPLSGGSGSFWASGPGSL
jgi:hypothetical protein